MTQATTPAILRLFGHALPPGGCTIHHCRTLHYAGPNCGPEPRRAYILTCRKPPVRRDAPRDFPWLSARRTAGQARSGQSPP